MRKTRKRNFKPCKGRKKLFFEEYNLHDPGLEKLIYASFKLFNLATFFTIGEKEVRAWTIKNGIFVLQTAGEIYSDMEKGFIKAEVYTFSKLMQYKSKQVLKDAG